MRVFYGWGPSSCLSMAGTVRNALYRGVGVEFASKLLWSNCGVGVAWMVLTQRVVAAVTAVCSYSIANALVLTCVAAWGHQSDRT